MTRMTIGAWILAKVLEKPSNKAHAFTPFQSATRWKQDMINIVLNYADVLRHSQRITVPATKVSYLIFLIVSTEARPSSVCFPLRVLLPIRFYSTWKHTVRVLLKSAEYGLHYESLTPYCTILHSASLST